MEGNGGRTGRFTFPVACRVRRGAEYDVVFKKGRSVSVPHFRVLVAAAPALESRLGLVVSKKVSKRAHDRNRVKRLLREYFRLNRHRFGVVRDVVVVARPGAAGLDSRTLNEELSRALDQWFATPQSS